MEKILTISIAAYNIEKYIEKTLSSLLIPSIDKLEILVQDDGSRDKTSIIAQKYEEIYPNSIKVIKKENGGYGSTINNSIKMATGKYFKQLDGDDWYDKDNLELLVKELEKIDTDIIYTPYYKYFEENKNIQKVDLLSKSFQGMYFLEEITKEIIKNKKGTIFMHFLAFKTEILKNNNIKCLEKCFYTDIEYALYPFMYSKDIFISKLPIYYYRIGREGQSMSIESRIKYYSDHLKVDELLLKEYFLLKNIEKPTYDYFTECLKLRLISLIRGFLLILPISKENLNKIKKIDFEIKNNNLDLYKKIERDSKVIFLLRKSNYFLYPILHYKTIFKLKKSLKNV